VNKTGALSILLGLGILLGSVGATVAETAPAPYEARLAQRTPPRLSFVDGSVSFRRAGASDWVAARLNIPLAPGDALYTGAGGNLELQFGPRAFVRAGADTQLRLDNQEPDFLQFSVTAGHASLDIRELAPGHTVELDTPNAAFTIERPGYYRVDVVQETTTFITRRAGRATVSPASGQTSAIAPSEEVVVQGADALRVETYVAPDLDAWDRWNYARTDWLLEAVSSRYVPQGVYGGETLDHHGSWRVVATYGPVWVPEAVPAGWAPYSAGAWLWDPFYGWTWVDDAPWGWAPFHYGRWVFIDGVWAWAPGPLVVRPVYSPALVAFFGGGPGIGWVALGWGEPLVPWWGPAGFIGVPWWAGWGGPRIVNNVVISRTTIVNVNNITVYRNLSVQNALVVVRHDHLGRGPVREGRVTLGDRRELQPLHGALPVKPVAASLVPASGPASRPPETAFKRVVGTRPPRDVSASLRAHGLEPPPAAPAPPRLVPAPPRKQGVPPSTRPPFGQGSAPERPRPPLSPRFESPSRAPEAAVPAPPHAPVAREAKPERGRTVAPSPRTEGLSGAPPAKAPGPPQPSLEGRAKPEREKPVPPAPPGSAPRVETPRAGPRTLPGEPANRLNPGRLEPKPRRPEAEGTADRPSGPAPEPDRGKSAPGAGEPARRPDLRQ
jgi:hypothetical protein